MPYTRREQEKHVSETILLSVLHDQTPVEFL